MLQRDSPLYLTANKSEGHVCSCVCLTYFVNIAWKAVGSSWTAPSVRAGASLEKGSDGELLIMDEVGD